MKRKAQANQRDRFIETAREIQADETGKAFERAFGEIVPPKQRPAPKPKSPKPPDKPS